MTFEARPFRTSWRANLRGLVDPCGSWQVAQSLEAHGSMLEDERTPLVSVTIQAPRLVRSERPRHCGPYAAMWIVAVDATHRALQVLVIETASGTAPERSGGSLRTAH